MTLRVPSLFDFITAFIKPQEQFKAGLHDVLSHCKKGLLLLCTITREKIYHVIVLALTAILSVFFAVQLPQLRFNYDFEAFFPNEDNELERYNEFRNRFEYDNEFILLAVENKKGVFRRDFLKKIDQLTQTLAKIPDIKQVQSPTNLTYLKTGGMVPVQLHVLHFEEPEKYEKDSIQIYQSPYFKGSFFPEDGRSLSLFIKTEDVLSKKRSDALADAVSVAVSQFHFDDVHLVGRIFAQQVYLSNIQKEFVWFLSLSFFLVIIFLWFTFRRPYGILVPVTVVLIAILWTLGIMSVLHKSVDIMAIMLPTMIFVAGMSDVVHFFSRYFEEQAKGTDRKFIFRIIVKEVGMPTLLTLLTTVVGFLSLLFSSIQPVRDFGIFTSLGVVLAFLLTYTFLPSILFFFHPTKIIARHEKEKGGSVILGRLLIFTLRKRKLIFLISAILLIITSVGISRIKINNILLEDLSDKIRIKQDFVFFDEHYSGVRPFELEISLIKGRIWDYEYMKQVARLDSFVKKEYRAGFLLSPASLVSSLYQATYEDTSQTFPDKEEYEELATLLQKNKNNKDLRRLVTADGKIARISAKTRDVGSFAIREHNQKLMKFIEEEIDPSLQIQLTGAAHLLDRNNEYMVSNMTQGFIFSIIIIALLTLVLHRSLKMVLVFFLPNIFPLAIIAGIMGFAGIELKAATSLIFSIAFGIATDDTIHFISRLKIELSYGKSILYALKRTYLETGKPIVLTTFILLGGFVSLTTSNFESTFYFGFLTCITMVIALAADLFLLPALLILVYGKKSRVVTPKGNRLS